MLGRVLRVLGSVLALVLTLGLALAVLVVTPDVDRWRAELPSLDDSGDTEPGDVRVADTLGWADSQNRKRSREQRTGTAGRDSYRFLAPAGAGSRSPGHWCSQRTIGYRVDLTGAGLVGLEAKRELRRWRDAFQRWRTASGNRYRFEYRGRDDFPLVRRGSRTEMEINPGSMRPGEIAITYATARTEPGRGWSGYVHRGLADTVGMGGIGPVNWDRRSPERGLIPTGTVIVDADDALVEHNALPTVYVHEVGHALGLGHVGDPEQIMFTDADRSAEIGPGDRRGIRTLARATCPSG